jgi:transposase
MKKYHVTLTEAERAELTALIAHRKASSPAVKRAYVLLAADENQPNWLTDVQLVQTYRVSLRTVERLRQRFVEEGLAQALSGKQRTRYKQKVFDGAVEAHLVALRCSQPPAGYARWSLRLLAQRMVELRYVEAIGRETVRQLLKKTP